MAAEDSARRLATIGDPCQRLSGLGEPWAFPARFNDDDRVPYPPHGGQPVDPGHVQRLRALNACEAFEACLPEIRPTRGRRDGNL